MGGASRLGRAVAVSVLVLLIATAGASAAGGPVYAGGSPKANRYMDIEIQVLAGGRRANWRIDVYGPCTENERLGRTVGTDAGNTPSDPRLRINSGRFTLEWHAHSSLSNLTYSYQLAGHAVAGGFAGTFHYHESEGAAYHCDSHLLHWRAHRRPGGFP
ncbi:MAG TPA: hypothetical protein VMG37_05820 [Solirubrobacteraceae bacterium]|nr:hypothetical protein [Solirubrobacteraceae bacterium]